MMRTRDKGRSRKNKWLFPPPSPCPNPPVPREGGRTARPGRPCPSPPPPPALFPPPGRRDAEKPPGEPHGPRVGWDGAGGAGQGVPPAPAATREVCQPGWGAAVLPGALGGGVPHDHTLSNFSEFAKIVSKAVCGEREKQRGRAGEGARAGPGAAGRGPRGAGRVGRGRGGGGPYLVRFAS